MKPKSDTLAMHVASRLQPPASNELLQDGKLINNAIKGNQSGLTGEAATHALSTLAHVMCSKTGDKKSVKLHRKICTLATPFL